MRYLLVVLIVFLSMVLVTSCTNKNSPPAVSAETPINEDSIAQILAKLSNGWTNIPMNKDTAYLGRIWAPDFFYVGADGNRTNKQQGIEGYITDSNVYTSCTLSNFKVRLFSNDFAVTTGDGSDAGHDKEGKEFHYKGRFTNVWVKMNGNWQCVAGHNSDLK